ncbi:MAG: hypothetical protein HYV97_05740 [Bdellovibrio sp.]|nr:hypothetical protein [Bdellovibrio sp.]
MEKTEGLSELKFNIKDDLLQSMKISDKVVGQHKNEKFLRLASDVSIFFNTPLLPMTFYYWGRTRQEIL